VIPSVIKKRSEFVEISRFGSRAKTDLLVVICLKVDGVLSVGFTASKKVGKAVKRNKARRRLKELVRLCSGVFPAGCSLVFIATKDTASCEFQKLKSDFAYCVRRSAEREKAKIQMKY
jgi:ribonuclease P protein component